VPLILTALARVSFRDFQFIQPAAGASHAAGAKAGKAGCPPLPPDFFAVPLDFSRKAVPESDDDDEDDEEEEEEGEEAEEEEEGGKGRKGGLCRVSAGDSLRL